MNIFDTSNPSDYEDNSTLYNFEDYEEVILQSREAGWPSPFTIEVKGKCDCCGQKIPVKLKKYYKIEVVDVNLIIAQARNLRLNRKFNPRMK